MTVQVDTTRTIGEFSENKNRPIVASLFSHSERDQVLAAAKRLSAPGSRPVIKSDLCPDTRDFIQKRWQATNAAPNGSVTARGSSSAPGSDSVFGNGSVPRNRAPHGNGPTQGTGRAPAHFQRTGYSQQQLMSRPPYQHTHSQHN